MWKALFLFIFLAGCTSLEKHHIFNVDRTDNNSRESLACKNAGESRDPLIVGKYRFYVRVEDTPYWLGVLFIPMVPDDFKFHYDRLRLIFGSELPQKPEDWSIQFESDGYVVKGQIERSSAGFEPNEVVFRFPPRHQVEKFQLRIPTHEGQVKIKFIETTRWEYNPVWLPLGDTFPHWQTCEQ